MSTVYNLCKLLIDRGRTEGPAGEDGRVSGGGQADPGGVQRSGRNDE